MTQCFPKYAIQRRYQLYGTKGLNPQFLFQPIQNFGVK